MTGLPVILVAASPIVLGVIIGSLVNMWLGNAPRR